MTMIRATLSAVRTHRVALSILVVLCLLVLLSNFLRASTAAIGPSIMEELAISPAALGTLTAAFFVVFTAFQIPAGIILDRYGPKRAMASLLGAAILGCLVFAVGNEVVGLSIGRGLMAIGTSVLLMSSLILCSRWFSPGRLGLVVGILLAVGNTGALLATAPMAWSASMFGWRPTFVMLGVATALLIVLILVVIDDFPRSADPKPQRLAAAPETRPARPSILELIRGLPKLLAEGPVRRVFVMGALSYGALITVLGLWGGPYLRHVHELETLAIGRVLLVMAVATIIGPLLYGFADRFVSDRRVLVGTGAAGTTIFLLLLAAIPSPPLWVVTVLLGGMGLIGTYNGALLSQARSLFPESTAGRGMTLINLAVMGGTSILQLSTGVVVQLFTGPDGRVDELGYRLTFVILAACVAGCLTYYLRPLPPERSGS